MSLMVDGYRVGILKRMVVGNGEGNMSQSSSLPSKYCVTP